METTGGFNRRIADLQSAALGFALKKIGARGRTWTGTFSEEPGILSPVRLPNSATRANLLFV